MSRKESRVSLSLRRVWQRRMGVEPTRDRAERPPSRFEDGETHRDLYTSILCRIVPCNIILVKPVHECAPPSPQSGLSPPDQPHVSPADHVHPPPQYYTYHQRAPPQYPPPHL